MNKKLNQSKVALSIEKIEKIFTKRGLKLTVSEEKNSTTTYIKVLKKQRSCLKWN